MISILSNILILLFLFNFISFSSSSVVCFSFLLLFLFEVCEVLEEFLLALLLYLFGLFLDDLLLRLAMSREDGPSVLPALFLGDFLFLFDFFLLLLLLLELLRFFRCANNCSGSFMISSSFPSAPLLLLLLFLFLFLLLWIISSSSSLSSSSSSSSSSLSMVSSFSLSSSSSSSSDDSFCPPVISFSLRAFFNSSTLTLLIKVMSNNWNSSLLFTRLDSKAEIGEAEDWKADPPRRAPSGEIEAGCN